MSCQGVPENLKQEMGNGRKQEQLGSRKDRGLEVDLRNGRKLGKCRGKRGNDRKLLGKFN